MKHYVYKVIHPDTEEFYFGMHHGWRDPALDGYFGSGEWTNRMAKERVQLKKEVIDIFVTYEEASELEEKLIAKFATHEKCQNKGNFARRVCGPVNVSPKCRREMILDFIKTYQSEHNAVSPTYDEIAKGVGLRSKSGVSRLLNGIAERGFIRRLPNRARAIEIIKGA